MEIERKFLLKEIPDDLEKYPFHEIEQGYLCTGPVVRIRRQDKEFYLTYKSGGMMMREEYNLPLSASAYYHLLEKVDGKIISKKRYLIPLDNKHTIELDVFNPTHAPLILAEVEFDTEEDANSFTPPSWFGEDVTYSKEYHNSYLSKH